ncbi:MAG: Ku protein [Acidimicrobiia bacterium]|nr:Ku protein [Acidimicrobiia bacterium]MDH5236543.1 Ku protein [Acidimicrobiia bacterium]
MARAIWSGSISFGLVSIPVKLHSAVRRKNVRFNQLDRASGQRVRQKRVAGDDGREVPYDDIVKGYELPSGEYVIVTDEEMAALDPEAVRTIDISEFVDLAEIDPIFYDSPYFLAPDATTAKPYRLLAEAMEQSQKVGIARFVMRTKQYLAAVRPQSGRLLLSTMVYADELVDPAEVDGFAYLDGVDVSKKELDMAVQLIESLSEDFTPEKHSDDYRTAVLELIERKAAGETEVVPAPVEAGSDTVVDLMAALEASVAEAKKARKRHPAATGKPTAKKQPAKKKAAAKRKSA